MAQDTVSWLRIPKDTAAINGASATIVTAMLVDGKGGHTHLEYGVLRWVWPPFPSSNHGGWREESYSIPTSIRNKMTVTAASAVNTGFGTDYTEVRLTDEGTDNDGKLDQIIWWVKIKR